VPVVFSSSTQAANDNPYGHSKQAAETALQAYATKTGAAVHIFRLTNVFGKWSRPNYNSAVATFCHQVANGQPLTIHDRTAALRLVYIDDVVDAFVKVLAAPVPGHQFTEVDTVYSTTVGEVAAILESFPASRSNLVVPPVGTGLTRALHSTYLSFLQPAAFAYTVPRHGDPRGEFVEMLKTHDSGQLSYFTAHPGITRGEHYHHSKTEKFLVIRGTARYGFRHVVTNETYEIVSCGGEGQIVETVPGWTHNITNIGTDELIVMLWANEIFDRAKPDTIARKVAP
jgi:UDP-2-acetamido-2,6-beta-L-arabino-hexul-4-ose reductase